MHSLKVQKWTTYHAWYIVVSWHKITDIKFSHVMAALMYMFWNWCIYRNTNVDSCRYTNGTTTFTHEYNIHGTVYQIQSSQFLCPLSVSQWHWRVLRLGSEFLHRWETPGQHHGWRHTGPVLVGHSHWGSSSRIECYLCVDLWIHLASPPNSFL